MPGDLDQCSEQSSKSIDIDIESLGLLLLECMEESTQRRTRTADDIRSFREKNQVFGLSNAGTWSGYQQLVDFIEELFASTRTTKAKLMSPVSNHITSMLQLANSQERICSLRTASIDNLGTVGGNGFVGVLHALAASR
jgi:hypothetical protein